MITHSLTWLPVGTLHFMLPQLIEGNLPRERKDSIVFAPAARYSLHPLSANLSFTRTILLFLFLFTQLSWRSSCCSRNSTTTGECIEEVRCTVMKILLIYFRACIFRGLHAKYVVLEATVQIILDWYFLRPLVLLGYLGLLLLSPPKLRVRLYHVFLREKNSLPTSCILTIGMSENLVVILYMYNFFYIYIFLNNNKILLNLSNNYWKMFYTKIQQNWNARQWSWKIFSRHFWLGQHVFCANVQTKRKYKFNNFFNPLKIL